jgi:hypothetical protein
MTARDTRRHRLNPRYRQREWEGKDEYDPTPKTAELCHDVLETWGDWLSPSDVVVECAAKKSPVSVSEQAVRRALWRLVGGGGVESRVEKVWGRGGLTGREVRFRVAERAYLKER